MGGDDRGGPRGPAGPCRRPGGPAPQQRPAAPPLPPSWPPGPTRPVRRGTAAPPPRANPPRPTALMPAAEPPRQRVADRPPVQPPRRPPAVRAPRRRGGWGRKLRVLLLVLLLAIAGFGVWVDTSLNRVDALPAESAGTGSGTNWLIVGSDSRAGLTAEQEKDLATGGDVGQRTDTIMLLHSGSSGPVLVSIPRDSYVSIAGHSRNKLNSAYAFGGAPLLVSTVEQATGLRIDHYAEIGFGGFVGAVDAVGGVDMCVPQAIKDPKAALNIKAGCQELDGATALGYVRTRATAGSDFDRVERQRAFLSALVKKATSPATLVNPFRVVPLTSAVTAAITVDESDHVWNLAGLGFAMRGISSGEGVTTTVPIGGTPTIGGQSVVQWDKTRAAALFTALENDQKPTGRALGP
ncbi:LCP family protein [Pseudonocardia charpentierae]|uniref:LCP family protein n=1 Tax=Pseudonocardia charpentierae TaxID=3075545 RepID=A0ABU2NF36_9PSEU|nr:LCP family protein [Pseudonocardia sp. DSM 45834]MDT0352566.1 LCP family protein [Pseudonocardia sp. DSM 45834]